MFVVEGDIWRNVPHSAPCWLVGIYIYIYIVLWCFWRTVLTVGPSIPGRPCIPGLPSGPCLQDTHTQNQYWILWSKPQTKTYFIPSMLSLLTAINIHNVLRHIWEKMYCMCAWCVCKVLLLISCLASYGNLNKAQTHTCRVKGQCFKTEIKQDLWSLPSLLADLLAPANQGSPEKEENVFKSKSVGFVQTYLASLGRTWVKMDVYLYAWVSLLTWRSRFANGSLQNGGGDGWAIILEDDNDYFVKLGLYDQVFKSSREIPTKFAKLIMTIMVNIVKIGYFM